MRPMPEIGTPEFADDLMAETMGLREVRLEIEYPVELTAALGIIVLEGADHIRATLDDKLLALHFGLAMTVGSVMAEMPWAANYAVMSWPAAPLILEEQVFWPPSKKLSGPTVMDIYNQTLNRLRAIPDGPDLVPEGHDPWMRWKGAMAGSRHRYIQELTRSDGPRLLRSELEAARERRPGGALGMVRFEALAAFNVCALFTGFRDRVSEMGHPMRNTEAGVELLVSELARAVAAAFQREGGICHAAVIRHRFEWAKARVEMGALLDFLERIRQHHELKAVGQAVSAPKKPRGRGLLSKG